MLQDTKYINIMQYVVFVDFKSQKRDALTSLSFKLILNFNDVDPLILSKLNI